MSARSILVWTVIVLVAVGIGSAIGEFFSGLSDAAWWRVLPWVLLALFWAYVGPRTWCDLRRRADGDG